MRARVSQAPAIYVMRIDAFKVSLVVGFASGASWPVARATISGARWLADQLGRGAMARGRAEPRSIRNGYAPMGWRAHL